MKLSSPNSEWHIVGHMKLSLVLRDFHFHGRRYKSPQGKGKGMKNLSSYLFMLGFTSGFIYTFLYNLWLRDLIPFLSLECPKIQKLGCYGGRALILEGVSYFNVDKSSRGKSIGKCYQKEAHLILQQHAIFGHTILKYDHSLSKIQI